MAAPGFGFSVGDFVAGAQLLVRVIDTAGDGDDAADDGTIWDESDSSEPDSSGSSDTCSRFALGLSGDDIKLEITLEGWNPTRSL